MSYKIVISHIVISLSKSIIEFNNFISTTQNNIKIIDPYLKGNTSYGLENNLQFYISYLTKYLNKGVSIQILTTNHEQSILRNLKTYFEDLGYSLDIISYDLTGHYQNTRIIHSRYLIIDDKKSLKLEKGLSMVFEFEAKGKLLNGIENEYNANISATEEILEKTFDPFWNYEHSLDEKIKNAVKIDTRILK